MMMDGLARDCGQFTMIHDSILSPHRVLPDCNEFECGALEVG